MSIRKANTNRVLKLGNNIADRLRNGFAEFLKYKFDESPSYFEVYINNSQSITGVQITSDTSKPDEKTHYVKYIVMKPGEDIFAGDLINWNNEIWLVTSPETYGGVYRRSKIVQTNRILKFYQDKVLRELPCFITSGSINYLDLKYGKFVGYSDGRYICVCPDLGYIRKDDLHLRFLLKDSTYKINGIDNITDDGLVIFELVDDKIIPNDNENLGIADYHNNQVVAEQEQEEGWVLTLTPTDNILYIGKTLRLNAHAFYNGVEDVTEFFNFTITDEDDCVVVDKRDRKSVV